jgi:hypothetical protein
MVKMLMTAAFVGVAVAGAGLAAQGPGRESAPKRSVAPPRTLSARVTVRDQDGASLSGVRVLLSGAGAGEFTTGAAGTAIVSDLKDGVYRVRCEREGFITLEREFTLHGSAWNPIDIVLNTAPLPPPPPPPAKPEPPVVSAMAASGPSITMSIPDFLDTNLIGREPFKESILACKPLETVRVLQMREAIARHTHDRADEVVYVVAGEGAVRIGEDATTVRPGSLVVVPHGSTHAFERRGKNPLIVVSTLVGVNCEPPKAAQ